MGRFIGESGKPLENESAAIPVSVSSLNTFTGPVTIVNGINTIVSSPVNGQIKIDVTIPAPAVPTLQAVTNVGATTTNSIVVTGLTKNIGATGGTSVVNIGVNNSGLPQLFMSTSAGSAVVKIDNLLAATVFQLPKVGGVIPMTVNSIPADANGNIVISGSGSASANNGLTETAGNFQLGGPLIKATTIDTTTFQLAIIGNTSGSSVLDITSNIASGKGLSVSSIIGTGGTAITATSTGIGIRAVSTNGIGISAVSTGGYAGTFESSSIALYAISTNDMGARIIGLGTGLQTTGTTSTNNSIVSALKIRSLLSSGVGAINNGVAIEFLANDSATASVSQGKIATAWTDATTGTKTSRFEFTLINSGVAERKMAIQGNGQLVLDGYTSTVFDSTPVKALGVDNLGRVVTFTPNSGGGGGGPYVEYANNDAALAGGLVEGDVYHLPYLEPGGFYPLAWVGPVVIDTSNYRLTEDGETRETEDGEIREV